MHFGYFFKYIFGKRSRQKLLILSLGGLLLSSFALIVLLGMMNGLQGNIINRSKYILGSHVIYLESSSPEFGPIINYLKSHDVDYVTEYEIEVLIRHRDLITPAIIHGIDRKLPFFKDKNNLVLSIQLSSDLKAYVGSMIDIISPAHTISVLGEVPRMISKQVGEVIMTNVTEVDNFHGFIDIKAIQNLAREKIANRIRIYGYFDLPRFKDTFKDVVIMTWEDLNSELNWSLLFEKRLMTTLFALMCVLISISIVSGLFIFFDRIQKDFISFWILGLDKNKLERNIISFIQIIVIIAIILGTALGLGFLYLLDNSSIELLPAIFLDRKIPIKTTTSTIILAMIIPYFLSTIFTIPALNNLKKRGNYLELLKSFNT